MIRKDIKSTLIFSELPKDKQEEFFSYSDKKFIHHIDTLYYSSFISGDDKDLKNVPSVQEFIYKLDILREKVIDKFTDIYYFDDIELLVKRKRFKIYDYCLSVNHMYDIFICSKLPNMNTPRIVVQLRSIGLWTVGVEEMIFKSYITVLKILSDFGLTVSKVQENRIDYAFHTNYIQSPKKYFTDKIIENNCDTTFDIFHKVGRKNKKSLTIEYLSLGDRDSNNLFFRIYNKTREVIEQNYKDFFIDYWYQNKLISFYDKFVYEYAYGNSTYKGLEWGKLEFYLKYGSDIKVKQEIELLKQDYSTNLEHVRDYIKDKLPEITLVMNIEYQTMRKFYYYSDKLINTLPVSTDSSFQELNRIFQIIDNRKIFLDYLTSETVTFKKNNYDSIESELKNLDIEINKKEKLIYYDWWYRLRHTKMNCNTDKALVRDYSRNLNLDKLKIKLKGLLASMSLYVGKEDSELQEDFSAALCVLNDNDIEDIRFVSETTGEILGLCDDDYINIKEKKKKSLKSLLKQAGETSSKLNDN